jgi:hypothetical protein
LKFWNRFFIIISSVLSAGIAGYILLKKFIL